MITSGSKSEENTQPHALRHCISQRQTFLVKTLSARVLIPERYLVGRMHCTAGLDSTA